MDLHKAIPFFLSIAFLFTVHAAQSQDLGFLEASAKAGGEIYTSNDLGMPTQSTLHSVLTYEKLGVSTDSVAESARESMPAPEGSSSTEYAAL